MELRSILTVLAVILGSTLVVSLLIKLPEIGALVLIIYILYLSIKTMGEHYGK